MAVDVTALNVLKEQVTSLTAQLQSLTAERDSARTALSDTAKERDTLRKSVADPDAQSARIAELEASIRDRNHYDKFAELAKGAKAKEKAVRDLWKLSGYKPEHDKIDEHALADVIERLKTEADYAFDSDDEPEPASTSQAARREAPPVSRSVRNGRNDGVGLTADQMANPAFMLDKRNQAYISAAVAKRQEQLAAQSAIHTRG